jgi:hypothetical protein
MTHSIRRRMRALAALSTCMLAVMATAGEGPASNVATTGESAIESLRSAVEREASRLRTSLDAAEATRDWTELLERKCTVDAAFAPLHLMLDAMEWQAPGACNDLFRTMRTEWLDAPVTAQWSHADGESRARRALAAWAPPPGGGQALRVEFRTGSEAWVAGDAPPTIQWTADGCWLEGRPSLHARCWWRLPVAEPVRFDFPLSADGFDVWWDQAGARLQDDRGQAPAERWRRKPERLRGHRMVPTLPGHCWLPAATRTRTAPSASARCAPRTGDCSAPNAGTGRTRNCVRSSSTRNRCACATTQSMAWKS